MKITIFTSNNLRHNYLVNSISKIAKELYVIQENNTIFPGKVKSFFSNSFQMQKYFNNVTKAQKKIFGNQVLDINKKKIKMLSIHYGDLKFCSLDFLEDFLKSDIYLVFGASYIKGPLVNFLIRKKAINIHMGISPYYRGSNCNFWALYDNNPNLVGATIHYLTSGLDDGKIIYHAISEQVSNPYIYSMSTVKSAILSLTKKLKDKSLLKIKPINQNIKLQKRYSIQKQFNDNVVKKYMQKKYKKKDFDLKIFKDYYLLKESQF